VAWAAPIDESSPFVQCREYFARGPGGVGVSAWRILHDAISIVRQLSD
jgi:hypothetical protein